MIINYTGFCPLQHLLQQSGSYFTVQNAYEDILSISLNSLTMI